MGTRPGPEDRHVILAFGAGLGAPKSLTQEQGACNDAGAWNTVAPGDAWTVQAQAGESPDDPNHVHVEFSVAPPAGVGTPTELGLALRWNRGGRVLQLPRVEGEEPDFADAATWETISYAPRVVGLHLPLIAVDGWPVRRPASVRNPACFGSSDSENAPALCSGSNLALLENEVMPVGDYPDLPYVKNVDGFRLTLELGSRGEQCLRDCDRGQRVEFVVE